VLTAIRIDLALLEQSVREGPRSKISREVICAEVESLKGLVDQAIKAVKQIAMELRPQVLDELGLIAALEWQAGEFEKRTGILCSVKSQAAAIDIDGDRAIAIFRIFQEALTNIVRHAQASSASASISEQDDGIVLQICDDGVGIDEREVVSSKSLGLIGMHERAVVFGGEVTVNGVKGHGTTVRVRIPGPMRQAGQPG
jgi:signal transduction histidine kinase